MAVVDEAARGKDMLGGVELKVVTATLTRMFVTDPPRSTGNRTARRGWPPLPKKRSRRPLHSLVRACCGALARCDGHGVLMIAVGRCKARESHVFRGEVRHGSGIRRGVDRTTREAGDTIRPRRRAHRRAHVLRQIAHRPRARTQVVLRRSDDRRGRDIDLALRQLTDDLARRRARDRRRRSLRGAHATSTSTCRAPVRVRIDALVERSSAHRRTVRTSHDARSRRSSSPRDAEHVTSTAVRSRRDHRAEIDLTFETLTRPSSSTRRQAAGRGAPCSATSRDRRRRRTVASRRRWYITPSSPEEQRCSGAHRDGAHAGANDYGHRDQPGKRHGQGWRHRHRYDGRDPERLGRKAHRRRSSRPRRRADSFQSAHRDHARSAGKSWTRCPVGLNGEPARRSSGPVVLLVDLVIRAPRGSRRAGPRCRTSWCNWNPRCGSVSPVRRAPRRSGPVAWPSRRRCGSVGATVLLE